MAAFYPVLEVGQYWAFLSCYAKELHGWTLGWNQQLKISPNGFAFENQNRYIKWWHRKSLITLLPSWLEIPIKLSSQFQNILATAEKKCFGKIKLDETQISIFHAFQKFFCEVI